MRFVLSAALALTLSFSPRTAAHAQEADELQRPEPIVLSDLLKIRRLGEVTVSPDSREIVYTVTSIVKTGEDAPPTTLEDVHRDSLKYRTHLYLVDASGRMPPRRLTQGDESATHPAWHPSGDRIAFVRTVDGKPQIFVLPLLGGEARQVTDFATGASNPTWSPDGSRILFASALTQQDLAERTGSKPPWPLERPGRSWGDADDVQADPEGSLTEIRAWLDQNAEDGNPRVLHRLDFLGEHDLEPEMEFQHFFVVDVDTTAEPAMITDGFNSFGSAEWLPDGERIVVSGLIDSDIHPDRVLDSHLYVVSADGGNVAPLLEMEGYALYDPKPSPNGRQLAFTARPEDDPGYAQTELGILSLEGGADPTFVTDEFDRSIGSVRWSHDGWYVYFTAPSDGGVPLYRLHPFESAQDAETATADTSMAVIDTVPAGVDTTSAGADTTLVGADTTAAESDTAAANTAAAPPGPQIERLTSYERGVQSYGLGRATVFFVGTDPSNPYELYAANLPFTSETRLTSHNTDWLDDRALSVPEHRSLVQDGTEIDYWIIRPIGFDSTRRYPLLLQIHGGPSAMWGPGEATMWHEFQFFASKGYAVVFANPRGSGGYGYDFQRGNYQDWGTGPAEDVLAAAGAAAEEPWIDSDRQVVTGGSYAGYLTAWIVAHDHRFRAAVAQRGVYDLDTFLGEGNAWRLVPWHFGGFPWEVDAATDTLTITDVTSDSLAVTEAATDTLAVMDAATDTVEIDRSQASVVSDSVAAALPPAEILERNSPITFVDQIETPLLIIHADNDLRTGVIQSEVLFRSLKILGRPVEYVRYPDAGHDLSRTGDPGQRLDRILRIYEFFERYVR